MERRVGDYPARRHTHSICRRIIDPVRERAASAIEKEQPDREKEREVLERKRGYMGSLPNTGGKKKNVARR